MDSDAPQVHERKGYLGGSDAGAILGLSPFASPFSVFADKLGIEVPRAADARRDERFHFGNAMQPVIIAAFSKRTGIACADGSFVRNAQHPFIAGHTDFFSLDDPAVIECKNIEYRGDEWGEPVADADNAAVVPAYYVAQCDHYMLACDLPRAYLVALFGGCRLLIYPLWRNAEREAILLEVETRFWKRVEEEDPPALDGIDDWLAALRSRYLASFTGRQAKVAGKDAVIQLDAALCHLLADIRQARGEIANLRKAERVALGALVIHLQGRTGYLRVADEQWGSLLMQERKRIDDFALQMEHPELYEKYLRTSLMGPVLRLRKESSGGDSKESDSSDTDE